MTGDLVLDAPESAALAPELARAAHYASQSRAASTRRAYTSDLRTFAAWCSPRGLSPMPASPATLAAYIASLADAGRSVSTIERALAAISQAHQIKGFESPTMDQIVRATMAGIRRTLGTAQHGKAPLLIEHLRAAVNSLPGTLAGTRDRAILLLGWAGAFRRSEVVALDVKHLRFESDGLVVDLERSKTDQEGEGRPVPVPFGAHLETCPVRSVRAWLEASGIRSGPVFRAVDRRGRLGKRRLCDRTVALVVKAAAERADLDPRLFAGHSLRAGLVTQAALSGKAERDIMKQTGHRSVAQLRKYIRTAELFESNAARGIGL